MVSINLEVSLSQDHLAKLEEFKAKRLSLAKIVHDEETMEMLENASIENLVGYFLTSKLW